MNNDDLYSHVSEPIAVLRKRFVTICNGNHCAAMMLDLFSATEATAREYTGDPRWGRDEEYNPFRSCTIVELTECFYGLFDDEKVMESFQFLINEEYITGHYTQEKYEKIPALYRQMKIRCQPNVVQEACNSYEAWFTTWEDRQTDDDHSSPPTQTPSPQPQLSEEEKAKIERQRIINEEQSKVKSHNKRASKVKLEATLTLEQWIETLEYFKWKCAYCQVEKYAVLEHFIPINHGGGTTQRNCVPACHRCNGVKQAWNPLASYGPDLLSIREGLERVRVYLESSGK